MVKRNRDPLSSTSHSSRSVVSPESCLLSGSKCKRLKSDEMKENISNDNKIKSDKFWSPEIEEDSIDKTSEEICPKKLNKGDSEKRKTAIKYIFTNVLDSPDRSNWKNKKVISTIMEKLQMPSGSRQTVLKVLESTLAGEDVSKGLSNRGRKRKFEDFSEEADFICDLFERTDSSDTTVTAIVNLLRVSKGCTEVELTSRSALRNFRINSECLHTSARNDENKGSDDIDAAWSQARLAQCLQFQEQLRIGELDKDHPDVVNSPFTPKQLHAVLFCDQKHQKQKLGRGGKRQVRASRDATGKLTSVANGGKYKGKRGAKSVKFPLEGRGIMTLA
jgi:hypothetical protein